MDKSAIRDYAVSARRKLMDAVRQKAYQYYITEAGALPPEKAAIRLRADGIYLTPEQSEARLKLTGELAALGDTLDNHTAYQHVIEEVAYTWFNRLIALRFMEVNDYLPSGIRILSSLEQGRAEPDALREAERLDFVDQAKIADFRSDAKIGAAERLYKYILISQCNALSAILPGTFQKLGDYTELLLPDTLYTKGGIVFDLVNAIAEDDFRDQVQIIGWLYQYYISEKKDEVFAALKNNVKITKETIPAATQLFTPEWIVKYMVENSLGRLWLESGLSHDKKTAADYGWKYYVEEAEQEPEVAEQLRVLRAQSPIKRPEDIKLIDPCMGSGHILAYALDVLFAIYQSCGYAESAIPNLILNNNIYGLDIDERAGQLAYFALMMKARGYYRRFFRQESIPQPMVYAFVETDGAQKQHLKLMGQGMMPEERKWRIDEMEYLMDLFVNAREYGSIIKIERKLDYSALRRFVKDCALGQMDWQAQGIEHTEQILLSILDLAETLARKYDVVVTNPPYMGNGGFSYNLSEYIKGNYLEAKNDMYSVMMLVSIQMCLDYGYISMITMQSWLNAPSFLLFRTSLFTNYRLIMLNNLGPRAFDEIKGEKVKNSAFVFSKRFLYHWKPLFIDLTNYPGEENKRKKFLKKDDIYQNAIQDEFVRHPLCLVVYKSRHVNEIYTPKTMLNQLCDIKRCIATGNDDLFIRTWFEVDKYRICDIEVYSDRKWYFLANGGIFRRWYGNITDIINWENNGARVKNFNDITGKSTLRNIEYMFKKGITYTYTSMGSGIFNSRYLPQALVSIGVGPVIVNCANEMFLLAYTNSKVFNWFIDTMYGKVSTFETGNIGYIPCNVEHGTDVSQLAMSCLQICKIDWNSFETSWDFQCHPLVSHQIRGRYNTELFGGKAYIETSYKLWQMEAQERFDQLKSNEEELNRIFIDIYGLQDELTPEVEDITVRKANLNRDIRSFVSYAVGCIFGRYSLDEPGLIYAGGQFDMSHYKTFLPEDDNILPIGSADYFNDDIVVRFTDFVRAVYGEESLSENLTFIANALYPNVGGTARDKIRRYFLSDFFKDHVKVYQKRPIYWLLDSGKMNGFKALVYLHRYDKYTMARVRTDYLHPLQGKYEEELKRLNMLAVSAANAREKAGYDKETGVLKDKLAECRVYDQVVSHVAGRQIELDLDDGVTVNYAKFRGVEVPRDNGKTEKMDLLAKI